MLAVQSFNQRGKPLVYTASGKSSLYLARAA